MMKNPRWYSALSVISHFYSDLSNPMEMTKVNRKAEELYAVALMLLGIQKFENKKYWAQSVPDEEQSPDVRTLTQYDRNDKKAPDTFIQDVEVVSYEFSSGESLPDFLLRTKLSKGKAYDEKTTILLRVKERANFPPSSEWKKVLKNTKLKSPVLALGRNKADQPDYSLIQVYPVYRELVTFNLLEEMWKEKSDVGTVNFSKGSRKKDILNKEKHCPFECLGISCEVLVS